MERSPTGCVVCAGAPKVAVAVGHDTLRQLILELLEQDTVCWTPHAVADRQGFAAAVSRVEPDLVVLADGDLAWCLELLLTIGPQRVVVIGPEPDPAYECAARRAGAEAWLSADRIGDDLIVSMRHLLGCTHDHCETA